MLATPHLYLMHSTLSDIDESGATLLSIRQVGSEDKDGETNEELTERERRENETRERPML